MTDIRLCRVCTRPAITNSLCDACIAMRDKAGGRTR